MSEKVTSAYRDFITQYVYVIGTGIVGLPDIRIEGTRLLPDGYLLLSDGTKLDFRVLADYLQRMNFIYLVAILEDYLLRALEILYLCDPSKLPIDRDRTVRFRDILVAKSKDELVEVMITQEVRGVRRSLPEMIHQFKKFSIDVGRKGLQVPYFVEIKAARNLWVHKGGRVDAEYLSQTADYWRMVDEKPPAVGVIHRADWVYVDHVADLTLGLVNTIEGHIVSQFPTACECERPKEWRGAGPGEVPLPWPPEPIAEFRRRLVEWEEEEIPF